MTPHKKRRWRPIYLVPIAGAVLQLALLLLALTGFFDTKSAPAEPITTAPARPFPALAIFAFGLSSAGVLFILLGRRNRRGHELNRQGVVLLEARRATEALAHFERALPLTSKASVVSLNLGVAHLALWQLLHAEAHLRIAQKRPLAPALQPVALALHALTLALQARVDEAKEHLAELARRGASSTESALLAGAVVHCRERDFAAAHEVLCRLEDTSLAPVERGLAEALRAWAGSETGERATKVDPARVHGEAGPQAVNAIWPEFAQFLENQWKRAP